MHIKQAERADLLGFTDMLKIIDYELGDKPDLIIRRDEKVIGVEHTRVYVQDTKLASGRQLLPQEKFHWGVIDLARKLFKRKSDMHLWVSVAFANPSNYKQKDIAETAELLVACIHKDISLKKPKPKEARNIRIPYLRYKKLPHPKDIVSVRYSVEDNPKMECWGPSYGYGVPELTPSKIQTIVSDKDEKLCGYTKCDEIWLLIVTDYGMPSSHFRIPENLTAFHYKTQFNRILLLIKTDNKLIELQVQH